MLNAKITEAAYKASQVHPRLAYRSEGRRELLGESERQRNRRTAKPIERE